MPTYEYTCSKCGHTFEVFQSMKDDPLETCPKDRCPAKRWGRGKVKRVIGTGAGIIFKGSGFYITDYRSESYREAAKKDVAPTAASSGGDKKAGSDGSSKASVSETPKKPAVSSNAAPSTT